MTKRCFRCKKDKSIDEFYLQSRRNNPPKPNGYCKTCQSEYYKERPPHRSNSAPHQKARRLKKWGVTEDELPHCCEICGTVLVLHLDHDHDTNEYRGTLCNRHNLALGLVHDSVDELLLLINYLRT